MLACDWCKKGSEKVIDYHLVWGPYGPILDDHQFFSHTWELCPDCASRLTDRVKQLVETIIPEAAGKPVARMPIPAPAGLPPPD
jgi:hypothetical protein